MLTLACLTKHIIYLLIANSSFNSTANFFKNATVQELADYVTSIKENKLHTLLNYNRNDFYKALRDIGSKKPMNSIEEVIKLVLKNNLSMKRKAFILFSKFEVSGQPDLLEEIITTEIIKDFPREYNEALIKNPYQNSVEIDDILKSFKMKGRNSFSVDELYLISRVLKKAPKELLTIFTQKKELFKSYLDTVSEYLFENKFEHQDGRSYFYSYETQFLYDSARELKTILETEKSLLDIFLSHSVDDDLYKEAGYFLKRETIDYIITSNVFNSETSEKILNNYEYLDAKSSQFDLYSSNNIKFKLLKRMKVNNKLPPKDVLEKTKLYKTLSKSNWYKPKLWLLNFSCNGLFKS